MRIIRKYPNRRLYDTQEQRFLNLEDLRALVLAGEEFKVEEKATGRDLTRQLLLQILAESDEGGQPILTTRLLRQVIRFYGNVMQGVLGTYLESALEHFLKNQEALEKRVRDFVDKTPAGLLADAARRNLEWWQSWQDELLHGRRKKP